MSEIQIPKLEIFGITGLPEIEEGDNLGKMLVNRSADQGTPLMEDDVVVVTQKIVSKSEGMLVNLTTIEPSAFATQFAEQSGKNPHLVELVLRESRAVVRMDPERGVIISETHHGFVCANAGIDTSNVFGDDIVCLLPVDPDKSARRIRDDILSDCGLTSVAVVISDTFGRAWREGHVNFAIGVAGMNPVHDYRGTIDASGKLLHVTTIATADELASAAEMATAKSINVPAAIVRGLRFESGPDGVASLLRDRSRDMFR